MVTRITWRKRWAIGQKAAFEAGLLSRRYGLERDRIAEFFSEYGNPQTVVYFYAGYDTPGSNEAVRTRP
ncbi:DUF2623 family protein [Symbiopectobacterium sp.]|uniref:DUF2623 family protein n=1 Tax=Symbiopectobacterium sp. TaxID=2952789 RepID=UPI003F324B34